MKRFKITRMVGLQNFSTIEQDNSLTYVSMNNGIINSTYDRLLRFSSNNNPELATTGKVHTNSATGFEEWTKQKSFVISPATISRLLRSS